MGVIILTTLLLHLQLTCVYSNHSLDVNSPVYIGQVPAGVKGSFSPGYSGCLRNIFVNGEVLDFSSPLLSSDIRLCVSNECMLEPCENGGQCFDKGRCDCPIEFSGATCDQGDCYTCAATSALLLYLQLSPSSCLCLCRV